MTQRSGRDGRGKPRNFTPGARTGELDSRAAYYRAKTEEVEIKNRVRRGELIEASDVRERWGRLASSWRAAVLATTTTAIQRGILDPAKADAHAALIEATLRHLADRGQA